MDSSARLIVVRAKDGSLSDVTDRVDSLDPMPGGGAAIRYRGKSTSFSYGPAKVAVMDGPEQIDIGAQIKLAVDGETWTSAIRALRFSGTLGEWVRVIYRTKTGDKARTYPADRVRLFHDLLADEGPAATFAHWREVVSGLASGDPMRDVFERITTVHPDSVLATYLTGGPTGAREVDGPVIYPFSTNVSQRAAVDRALRERISVVEGPPGTGKTQTILNIIANVVGLHGGTVGVVSSNNAAVDNVREKLDKLGVGLIVGSLGRKEKRAEFFGRQDERALEIERLLAEDPTPAPEAHVLDALDRRLVQLQHEQCRLAEAREDLDAHRTEHVHFVRHLGRTELPDLDRLPLLRKSSERILDYLADSSTQPTDQSLLARATTRVRRYFRYGLVSALDPRDASTVLALQAAYYDRRIAELEGEVAVLEARLAAGDVDEIAREHAVLSQQVLQQALHGRYQGRGRVRYTATDYRSRFREFVHDYPLVLSTCHSLRGSLPEGHLLDLLIVDEASQVGLLEAVAVLGSCRNLVVVGDLRQLQQITQGEPGACPPPSAAHDYHRHNILSSLVELYGDTLPRTLLREHYRCDPRIIGFCNARFYDGLLIPFRPEGGVPDPLVVVRTAEGNHMRRHTVGERGRSNQREVDVIREEIIPRYSPPTALTDIGITTPYRRQVSTLAEAFPDFVESDTVHRYQGREKDLIIMSTVLDETRDGHFGVSFVDDPHLVNVAVSRARKRFVLVTNHDMLPRSRNLRELIDYALYQDPDQRPVDSEVISVFDLLYRRYSERLRPFAAKMSSSARFKSEEAGRVLLEEVLAEPEHHGLTAVHQVLLRNLVPRPELLDDEQRAYVGHRSSVDFVVYSAVSRRAVLAIEVDGHAFHANDERQTERDALKNQILERSGVPLLRLPTTGSGEHVRLRAALAAALSRQLAP